MQITQEPARMLVKMKKQSSEGKGEADSLEDWSFSTPWGCWSQDKHQAD